MTRCKFHDHKNHATLCPLTCTRGMAGMPYGPRECAYTVRYTPHSSMGCTERDDAHGHAAYYLSHGYNPTIERTESCPTCNGSGEIATHRKGSRTVTHKPCPRHVDSVDTVEEFDQKAAAHNWRDRISALHNGVDPAILGLDPYTEGERAACERWRKGA